MKLHSYPKVLAVGHRYIADIFDGPVLVEEKIDGSQISFGMVDGELCIKSRNKKLIIDAPDKMFTNAIESIQAIQGELTEGWIYRGEYLKSPCHNVLAYDRIPNGHIIIFDIEMGPNNPIADHTEKVMQAKYLGFECVPQFEVDITGPDVVIGLLETTSCLGGQKIEGIVVKSYDKITPDGKHMVGKYVSDRFKERHTKKWGESNPGRNDVIEIIIASLKTDARRDKALQHLKENGDYTGTPQDIGKFLKEIHLDIETEEKDYIAEKLVSHFLPQIKRAICGGAPEWYKQQLLEGAFK